MAYPYLHDSSGVVLSTARRRNNWQREPVLLPALRKIRFLTERQGWAVGCPSAMFPGGTFTTRDAGRSWQPACGGGTSRLATGDFFDGRNAILGGSLGLMATISEGDFSRNPQLGVILHRRQRHAGRSARLRLAGRRRRLDCPDRQSRQLVAAAPGHASARGRPSSTFRRWPSADRNAGSPAAPAAESFSPPTPGRTWSAFPTGSTLPLRAITFVDDLHGWAVGQLGLIMSSSDGGRTWRRQRSGGARAAVMAVAGMPQDLPLELLARICKDQGHLGVAEVLGRSDVETTPRGDVPPADRLHQAMLQVGACCRRDRLGISHPASRFAASRQQAILEGWNRVHNGHGCRRPVGPRRSANSHLAAQRDFDSSRPRFRRAVARSCSKRVAAAVKLAGDPTYLADQFGPAGCEPWNVQRVYLVSDSKARLARSPWTAMIGRRGWDKPGPTPPCRPGPSWTMMIKARRPWPAFNSSRAAAGRRMTLPRGGHSPADSAIPRIASTSWPGLHRSTVLHVGRCRKPTAGLDSPLDGLAQGRQVQAVFEHVRTRSRGGARPIGQGRRTAAGHRRFGRRRADIPHRPAVPAYRSLGSGRQNPGPAHRALSGRSACPLGLGMATPEPGRQRKSLWLPTRRPAIGKEAATAEIRVPSRHWSWPARSRSIGPICLLRRRFGIRWRPPIGNWGKTRRPSGSMTSITTASIATPGGTVPAVKCGCWIAKARRPSRW